ncbi:MAG: PfkB family carbohydrate kinase [Bacteroidia bacterium]|nr:PfkB family carbohydrate kinase [Bacteroidia bacterium]
MHTITGIEAFLARCSQLRVLVVGDMMLDQYLWGRVDRISPEAPVPVVEVSHTENRPGGAANVALNVAAMGATAWPAGIIGQDASGQALQALMQAQGFELRGMVPSPVRTTTTKTRVLAQGQQMLRFDREDRFALTPAELETFRTALDTLAAEADVIILEDYDKGLFAGDWLPTWLAGLSCPVVVDPKFRQFFHYAGVTLFKPNLKELNEGMGTRHTQQDLAGIVDTVQALRARMPHTYTAVTLGDAGMLIVDAAQGWTHIPAHRRAVADVSGAGDTVVTVLALGLAAGLSPREAARYANLAGGIVCESPGVVPVDKARLAAEAITLGWG